MSLWSGVKKRSMSETPPPLLVHGDLRVQERKTMSSLSTQMVSPSFQESRHILEMASDFLENLEDRARWRSV